MDFEVAVIGSGFGGAILACRTAKKWPGSVLVLERGKRYPLGSFPRSPHAMAENFWNVPSEDRARPSHVPGRQLHGMFDIRTYDKIDAVLCAGLGGGSLIYANVFLEPPDQVFAQGWPNGWNKQRLASYYALAKSVLGSRPVPQGKDPRRKILRTGVFAEVAQSQGLQSRLADINVFFGNNFADPLDIGVQDKNRYGAIQTSCVYCGECDIGCNTQSKNTVDLNYLFAAEHRYRARILTEHLATKIVPLGVDGSDDPTALGENGYRVYYNDLSSGSERSASARRVIVSSGALGSTELLMRCRDVHGTLPHVPQTLGRRFSGNGDFLSFAIAGEKPADPNYGPVITQYTDHNLFANFDRSRAFLLEDAAYPVFASWYAQAAMPLSALKSLTNAVRHLLARLFSGASVGRVGFLLSDALQNDLSYGTCVLLCMGLDNGQGVMRLNRNGYLDIEWPQAENMLLYDAVLAAAHDFGKRIGAKVTVPMPNWWPPMRHNITVHALGGCIMADAPQTGVVSAAQDNLGQVFGYSGLYVADGAIVPTAVGANPTATIAALSEMIAERITGVTPTDQL